MIKHLNHILLYPAVFFVSALVPLTAPAENHDEMDGHQLLKKCRAAVEYLDNGESTDDIDSVRFCDDYLTGFRETENVKRIYMPGFYTPGYCFPRSGVSNGEAVRVIVNYLQTHEQELDQPATELLRNALADGYPCN